MAKQARPPFDPRFRGATPRKLAKALKRPKPKKDPKPDPKKGGDESEI